MLGLFVNLVVVVVLVASDVVVFVAAAAAVVVVVVGVLCYVLVPCLAFAVCIF